MGTLALNFILAHKEYAYGVVSGYGLAHLRQAFDYAYDYADKFPAFHNFIVKHSSEIEGGIADLADEAKKKIEESKAKDAPKP